MKPGDIYWVKLPQKGGHEQEGQRPVVIMVIYKDVPITTVIPLTTAEKAKSYNNTMLILPDDQNNLSESSVALIFQVLAIDNKRLLNKIGQLTEQTLMN